VHAKNYPSSIRRDIRFFSYSTSGGRLLLQDQGIRYRRTGKMFHCASGKRAKLDYFLVGKKTREEEECARLASSEAAFGLLGTRGHKKSST